MITFSIIWLTCSVLCYGLAFATAQRSWPVIAREHLWNDFGLALLMGAFGPISLAGYLIATTLSVGNSGFHGFKWLPIHEDK